VSTSDGPEEALTLTDPQAVAELMAQETGMTLEEALDIPAEDHGSGSWNSWAHRTPSG
jgi:hypothetical protein